MIKFKFLKSKKRITFLTIILLTVFSASSLVFAQYVQSGLQSKDNETYSTFPREGVTLDTGSDDKSQNKTSSGDPNSPSVMSRQDSSAKTYTPGVCTETPIPYQTEYMNDALMNKGETRKFLTGVNGYTKTCTADSNGKVIPSYTSPPTNEVLWIGTKESSPSYPPATQPTRNYSQCNQFYDTGSYQACIDAVNRQ